MRSLRIELISCFALLLGLFLLHTGYTSADIFAERRVTASIRATTLAMGVLHSANNRPADRLFTIDDMVPDGFDVAALRVKKLGKMGFTYRISPHDMSGDIELCEALNIEVWKKTEVVYTGKLQDMIVDSTLTTTKPDDWIFLASLGSDGNSLKNKSCTFDIRFKTYKGNAVEALTGFFSRRYIRNTVSTAQNW